MSCHDAAVPPTFSSIITGMAKDSRPTGDIHNYGRFARDSSRMLCFCISLDISCNFLHVSQGMDKSVVKGCLLVGTPHQLALVFYTLFLYTWRHKSYPLCHL